MKCLIKYCVSTQETPFCSCHQSKARAWIRNISFLYNLYDYHDCSDENFSWCDCLYRDKGYNYDLGYVYLIGDDRFVKIGYSKDPRARLSDLQVGNARPLSLMSMMIGGRNDEARLHAKFGGHIRGEWFFLSDDIRREFGVLCRHDKVENSKFTEEILSVSDIKHIGKLTYKTLDNGVIVSLVCYCCGRACSDNVISSKDALYVEGRLIRGLHCKNARQAFVSAQLKRYQVDRV